MTSVGRRAVRLRSATAADAPAIGRVFDAAVLDGWGYFDHIESMVPMFGPDHWDRLVAETTNPDLLLVATDGPDVVGFVATRAAEGELYLLFVDPACAGRGVGRRLLHAAHDSLREHGHDQVFLYTHEANERARTVYEAAGYRHDGGYREEEFQGQLRREVRLRASLRD